MVQDLVSVLILLPLLWWVCFCCSTVRPIRHPFTRHHQTRYEIPLLWTFDRLGTHENAVIGFQLNVGIQWHVQLLSSKQSERYDLEWDSSTLPPEFVGHSVNRIRRNTHGNIMKLEWTYTISARQYLEQSKTWRLDPYKVTSDQHCSRRNRWRIFFCSSLIPLELDQDLSICPWISTVWVLHVNETYFGSTPPPRQQQSVANKGL